jgi:PAS domain S-box-containing protein
MKDEKRTKRQLIDELLDLRKRIIELEHKEAKHEKTDDISQESEHKFKTLFDLSPQAIALTDIETGKLIDVNEKFCELTKFNKTDIIGQTTVDAGFYSKDDRNRFLKEIKEKGAVYGLEMNFKAKDGSILNALMFSKVIELSDISYILTVFVDVTEQKTAEEALKKSRAYYMELADSISDVFFAMDKDLKYTYWNKASETLTDIPAKDAIGKSFYEIFPDIPERTRAERAYLNVLRTKQPETFVNEWYLRNEKFIFEISVYPSSTGISIFVKDITERKKTEAELKKRIQELEDFYDMAVGRELRMKELKEEIEDLKEELEKYKKE